MVSTSKSTREALADGKVVALIKARGSGSTLAGKNMRLLLGKPVIEYALETLLRASFLDKVYVWSEDELIKASARRLGAVGLHRPLSMVHYNSGFHTDQAFNFNSLNQIKEDLGSPIKVMVNFNCNLPLFRTKSLEQMFKRLMDDSKARWITALAPVKPGLCLTNGQYGLLPFMNDENIHRQDYPNIYRKLGVSMMKCGLQYATLRKQIYLQVDREEGIDLHSIEDSVILEYYLKKRWQLLGEA